jgi:hypothetical protein
VGRFANRGSGLLLVALAAGCVGKIDAPAGGPGTGPGTGPGVHPPIGDLDVGSVGIHRLNNAEYDNTVHDLLGVTGVTGVTGVIGLAATSFIPDEKALGFDTIADAFTMSDARYEQYFDSADALVEQAFADAALRGRIVTCAPASPGDPACTRQIIQTFGRLAWRRPLAAAEIDSLAKLADDALTLGEDWNGAIKQVVKTMLVSPPFLYRVETDPTPDSATPHPLGGYEMASRLSYLFWSTMPDDRLFALADGGQLLDDTTLAAEVDRLLADGRATSFVSSFAGQWLGLRDLANHAVEPTAFPAWDQPLRQAMIEEGLLYFSDFLTGTRGMSEFLTADMNFVNARLGTFYGIAGATSNQPVRLIDTGDQRQGFLGLASFLTVSSYSYRTAPTLRGKWVLENLLCETIPAPPPDIPKLDDGNPGSAATQALNVRDRLAEHRANPACARCHLVLDPIGLGLENFDATGQYRQRYANGDAIDASGVMPDGSPFNGITDLSALLARDSRFLDCASRKLMTYALSRELGAPDAAHLLQIRESWSRQGFGLRALIKLLVANPTFRYRHG